MTLGAMAGAASVLTLGAFMQSAAGFGFGLFAVPALLILGFPLPQAIMLTVAGSAVQKILGVIELRKSVNWRELRPLIISGLLTLPLGLWFMIRLTEAGKTTAGRVVAVLIVVLLLLRRFVVPAGHEKVAAIWGVCAGAVSGILNGLANIGGPPVVLWILSHRWGNEKMRVTVMAQSLFFVPLQAGVMLALFGTPVLHALGWGMAVSPLVILGTRLGLRLGSRIPVSRLRTGMELLLLLMAISAARPF